MEKKRHFNAPLKKYKVECDDQKHTIVECNDLTTSPQLQDKEIRKHIIRIVRQTDGIIIYQRIEKETN